MKFRKKPIIVEAIQFTLNNKNKELRALQNGLKLSNVV